FWLSRSHAALQRGGQGAPEQGAPVLEGDLLAGGQDGAVRGGGGEVAELADEGDGLLRGEPLGLVWALNRQRNHPQPSQGPKCLGRRCYQLPLPKSRGAPRRQAAAGPGAYLRRPDP